MKNTIIVNLIGPPGVGKTTAMAGIFNILKTNDIDAEMVSEFAKELIYENRKDTMKDELYIFAKQSHRLFMVNGKVDVIITDRPLILTVLFNNLYGKKSKNLDNLVIEEFKNYNNINFFLNRNFPYKTNGRNESEELANKIGIGLKNILKNENISFIELTPDSDVVNIISQYIINYLNS